eukprot:46489_1
MHQTITEISNNSENMLNVHFEIILASITVFCICFCICCGVMLCYCYKENKKTEKEKYKISAQIEMKKIAKQQNNNSMVQYDFIANNVNFQNDNRKRLKLNSVHVPSISINSSMQQSSSIPAILPNLPNEQIRADSDNSDSEGDSIENMYDNNQVTNHKLLTTK